MIVLSIQCGLGKVKDQHLSYPSCTCGFSQYLLWVSRLDILLPWARRFSLGHGYTMKISPSPTRKIGFCIFPVRFWYGSRWSIHHVVSWKPVFFFLGFTFGDEFRTTESNHILLHSSCGQKSIVVSFRVRQVSGFESFNRTVGYVSFQVGRLLMTSGWASCERTGIYWVGVLITLTLYRSDKFILLLLCITLF